LRAIPEEGSRPFPDELNSCKVAREASLTGTNALFPVTRSLSDVTSDTSTAAAPQTAGHIEAIRNTIDNNIRLDINHFCPKPSDCPIYFPFSDELILL
jgi:hypothetical protein